jgi:hypothetical protein
MIRRKLLIRVSLFVACTAGAALSGAPALAVNGHGVGQIRLQPSNARSDAHGTATLVIFVRGRPEINVKANGLPEERNPAFIAWTIDDRGRIRIVGAFPRTKRAGFSGSLIVPGPRRDARRNLRAAKRLVITKVSRPRGFRVFAKAERSHFQKSLPITGERLMQGRVEPLGRL